MKELRFPPRLKAGSRVRVTSPSGSLNVVSSPNQEAAISRLRSLELDVSLGQNVNVIDEIGSSPAEMRLADLHTAFQDRNVDCIVTSIGGFNANQLLSHLNFDLIANNAKVFCGYSDITALQNAILTKSGLVTYSGPHFSTFAMKLGMDYTIGSFKECLYETRPFEIVPSPEWSDDAWYIDQDQRKFIRNGGHFGIQEGECEGTVIGGNLGSLLLLQGTQFMPSLEGKILFLEETGGPETLAVFDRNLQSLMHRADFRKIVGIVIGRFPKAAKATPQQVKRILMQKSELPPVPILGEVDFGHTSPMVTFPIGGTARLSVGARETRLTILSH